MAAPSLRRSKREHTARSTTPPPATAVATNPSPVVMAAPQRRSARNVKSTYATCNNTKNNNSAAASNIPTNNTKVAAKDEEAITTTTAIGNSKKRADTRHRSKASTSSTTANSAPAVVPSDPPTVSVENNKSTQAEEVQGSTSTLAASIASNANKKRRPVGGRTHTRAHYGGVHPSGVTTVMGDSSGTARTQMRKVLGKYTARECTLLCEVILEQIKKNSIRSGVLEAEISPARIRWDRISQSMVDVHRLQISARDCQELWKFLAYGQTPPKDENGDDQSLLPDSDADAYDENLEVLNQKYLGSRSKTNMLAMKTEEVQEGENVSVAETDKPSIQDKVKEEVVDPTGGQPATIAPQNEAKAHTGESVTDSRAAISALPPVASTGLRLYPMYALPAGIPDEWQTRSFQPKDMFPLTFVAEKFLRKKASGDITAPPNNNEHNKNMPATTSKRPADATPSHPKKVKQPKKTHVTLSPTANPTLSSIQTSSLAQPSTNGRDVFVPSSTPPPVAAPPRSELEFFCKLYEENPSAIPSQDPSVNVLDAHPSTDTANHPQVTKSPEEMSRLFTTCSLEIRTKCQQLASDDLDRYNRECLRRRLWEKATAIQPSSTANSPQTTPLATAVQKVEVDPVENKSSS